MQACCHSYIRGMKIIVLANAQQQKEWLQENASPEGVTWVGENEALQQYRDMDAVIDLLFDGSADRVRLLQQLGAGICIVNSVADTLDALAPGFVRINGWNSFLAAPVIEASCKDASLRPFAESVFSHLYKTPEWLPDQPGFVTARVISGIINEAFLALEEGVSTREDINTAMKLGTNYPFGPFEWADLIGRYQVHRLLQRLEKENARYKPAALLAG